MIARMKRESMSEPPFIGRPAIKYGSETEVAPEGAVLGTRDEMLS